MLPQAQVKNVDQARIFSKVFFIPNRQDANGKYKSMGKGPML